MKLISYNVNGVRAAIKKGLIDWLKDEDPDIFCIQECKAQESDVDIRLFSDLGYNVFWHSAEKKGYSGVVIFSKLSPISIKIGCGEEEYDREGRVIRLDFDEFSILNVYMPSGTTGDIRQDFKMKWLEYFQLYIDKLKIDFPNLIICGDFNIANHEIDIHNPVSNKNSSGFLPEEREWLTSFIESGFVDSFRRKYPDEQKYSWWTYRANARTNNKGWRIDYFVCAEPLWPTINDARILNDIIHSDHCPILLELFSEKG